jgi:hypothetical protein
VTIYNRLCGVYLVHYAIMENIFFLWWMRSSTQVRGVCVMSLDMWWCVNSTAVVSDTGDFRSYGVCILNIVMDPTLDNAT